MHAAYAAGFLDGDGSIVIANHKISPTLRVSVSNTYRPVLESFRESFGGNVHTQKAYPGSLSVRQQHIWYLSGAPAAKFLSEIYPYLQEKKVRAWIGLESLAQSPPQPGIKLSEEQRALREGYRLAMLWATQENILELASSSGRFHRMEG